MLSPVERRISFRRQERVIFAFGLILIVLLVGIGFAGVRTWIAFQSTLGADTASNDWLHRKLSSYYKDTFDEGLALRRLQVSCWRFANGKVTTAEFNLQRRQVASNLAHFGNGSLLAKDLSQHSSFVPAYEAATKFQTMTERLEKGEVGIDVADASGEEAVLAWSQLLEAAISREYELRDGLEKAVITFNPLMTRAVIIGLFLLGLATAAAVAALYAAWRTFQAEHRRFDRFELLLATIGHDLRSPLQALVGAAKLAAADKSPLEREKFVRIVRERSAFFTRLLDDLVDLARSESLSWVASSIDLSVWFEAAAVRYRQSAEAKKLAFVAKLLAPVRYITFDLHRLTQCADNLVFNALRYTDRGTVTFVVQCDPGEEPSDECKLKIEVTDTGRGIAVEDQARIFEPFVRLESAEKGMGVGLSMVSSVARRVGGALNVRSARGQGSTFTFTAPVVADSSPPGFSAAEPLATQSMTVDRTGRTSRTLVPRVLVVDDDEHITRVVGGLLPHMGFIADVAFGGQAGLALAKQHSYCAILTDIEMPDLDGFEMAEALRACLQPCPVLIAMTAYTANLSADQRSRVFDAMLRKPFDEDELGELLDNAATRWSAMPL